MLQLSPPCRAFTEHPWAHGTSSLEKPKVLDILFVSSQYSPHLPVLLVNRAMWSLQARNMGLPLDFSLFLMPHNEVQIHECPYFYFLDCAQISTALSALFSPPAPPALAQLREQPPPAWNLSVSASCFMPTVLLIS